MESRVFYNFYAKRSKKGVNDLETSNPFHFASSYGLFGCIKFRVNEESNFSSAIAVRLHNVTDLPSNHSFFLIFRISCDKVHDIIGGDISLKEAFDNYADSLVYVVQQSHYSSSPYEVWAFSRNDVPLNFLDELSAERMKYKKEEF